METIIYRKISPKNVIKLFEEHSDIINIRYYEPVKPLPDVYNSTIPVKYKIRIRHNIENKPADIYKQALKQL